MFKEVVQALETMASTNSVDPTWYDSCPALGQFATHLQAIRKPVVYPVIVTNFFITLILLSVTFFCRIPGRVFKLFIYNTYGLNLIYLAFFTIYAMHPEWFNNIAAYTIYGFGTVFCKNTALSTVLPYTCIRYYFIIGFKNCEDSVPKRYMLLYTILYDIIIGLIFYALFILRILHYEDEKFLFISAYTTTTLQGFIIISAITFIICTTIFIQNTTISQKFLMNTNEALPDRQKIIRICVVQIVLYAIQGSMELLSYVAMLNDFEWLCHYKFFVVLVFFIDVIEQLCVIVFALIILCCLNSYKKALYVIYANFINGFKCLLFDNSAANKRVLL